MADDGRLDPGVMDWSRLMAAARFRGDGARADVSGDGRSAYLRDADRIIFSSAFRRMQDKTQVHSLAGSDYVRTRLTHSLEASSVGRSLGVAAGHLVLERHPDTTVESAEGPVPLLPSDFGEVVAAACLAHDIGNPPFGHAGEDAVRWWFDRQNVMGGVLDALSLPQRSDFLTFEGNAQGFRILTRLSGWRERGGMQLSCATLAAFTKYPFSSRTDIAVRRKKFGFFQDDAAAFQTIAEITGLLAIGPEHWCRHPLAYLVEAADDIAYLVVDIEDGFKLGEIAFDIAHSRLRPLAGENLDRYELLDDDSDRITYLRAKAIGRLIDVTVQAFDDHYDALLAGRFDGELLDHTPLAGEVAALRQLSLELLQADIEKLRNEVGGAMVLHGLLDTFSDALLRWEELDGDLAAMPATLARIIRLLPEGLIQDPGDRYHWLLRMTDYISGMTDGFALQLFRRLSGHSLGGVRS